MSNLAFKFYYVKPISYYDSKEEIVKRYDLFDEKSYDYLYEVLAVREAFTNTFGYKRITTYHLMLP